MLRGWLLCTNTTLWENEHDFFQNAHAIFSKGGPFFLNTDLVFHSVNPIVFTFVPNF